MGFKQVTGTMEQASGSFQQATESAKQATGASELATGGLELATGTSKQAAGAERKSATASGPAKATFGAGCFWGVEARFAEMTGVLDTAVGYEGGKTEHPTYKEVCSDRTGHAEVVQITFNPARVSYETLLDAFFSLHDPTQMNRQGPDWGTQYRSIIFTHSEAQERAARQTIADLNASGTYRQPVVTQVMPSTGFWKAEEYHQRYLEKRGMVSCHI